MMGDEQDQPGVTATDESGDRLAVDVQFEVPTLPGLPRRRVREIVARVCRAVAESEGLEGSEVAVSVVSDWRIRELNRKYRDTDAVTDVLSFAMREAVDGAPAPADEAGVKTLGDIVVSWPRTKAQAKEYGHGLERELAFLVAHGMFHLLGFDHQSSADEQAMIGRQERVLSSLGFTR